MVQPVVGDHAPRPAGVPQADIDARTRIGQHAYEIALSRRIVLVEDQLPPESVVESRVGRSGCGGLRLPRRRCGRRFDASQWSPREECEERVAPVHLLMLSVPVAEIEWDAVPLIAVADPVGVPVMTDPESVAATASDNDSRCQGSEPQEPTTPTSIRSGVQEFTVALTVLPDTEPPKLHVTPAISTDVGVRVVPSCATVSVAVHVLLSPRARATFPRHPPPVMSPLEAVRVAVQVPATSAVSGGPSGCGVGATGDEPSLSQPAGSRTQSTTARTLFFPVQ